MAGQTANCSYKGSTGEHPTTNNPRKAIKGTQMSNEYVLTTDDNGNLAVRTVVAEESSTANSTDIITATTDGKLAVRVVGNGGGGSGDSHNKGYFATQAALEEAYPTGEAGDWAIVGSTDTVWLWDSDNDEWKDTDQKGQVESVNGKTGTVVLNASDVGALQTIYDGDERPELSEENLNKYFMECPEYGPDLYKVVDFVESWDDGNATIEYYHLTPDVEPSSVIIDFETFNAFTTTQEIGFDGSDDLVEIYNDSGNLMISYNFNGMGQAQIQTDGTVSGIQQALVNIGITVDLGEYSNFEGLAIHLPKTVGYQYKRISAFVPPLEGQFDGFVLKTNGNDIYWDAESGLPDQTGHSGEFLTTDGTDASWATISALQNTATGTNSLTILGTAASTTESVNVGMSSSATAPYSTAIGQWTEAKAEGGTAIGRHAVVEGYRGTAVGMQAHISQNKQYGIAIGFNTAADANYAIQLGGIGFNGTSLVNSDANTFKVGNANGNYELMSADGTIPEARLADMTNAAQGQVLTLDSNNNAVWATPGGGGGGSATATTATLAANAWSSNSQTVNVTGVTSSNIVFVMPAPATQGAYNRADIQCTAQGSGTLTFTCANVPTTAITVNIIIM